MRATPLPPAWSLRPSAHTAPASNQGRLPPAHASAALTARRPLRARSRRRPSARPQLIEPLLAAAHHERGQVQRNAAICLARLAKNERCMAAIREQHGLEILMQYAHKT